VTVADLKNEAEHVIKAKFVFIGAGGAALKLLQVRYSEAKSTRASRSAASSWCAKTRKW
jgi:L-2-hydroxyglutarate oxidase LhgO